MTLRPLILLAATSLVSACSHYDSYYLREGRHPYSHDSREHDRRADKNYRREDSRVTRSEWTQESDAFGYTIGTAYDAPETVQAPATAYTYAAPATAYPAPTAALSYSAPAASYSSSAPSTAYSSSGASPSYTATPSGSYSTGYTYTAPSTSYSTTPYTSYAYSTPSSSYTYSTPSYTYATPAQPAEPPPGRDTTSYSPKDNCEGRDATSSGALAGNVTGGVRYECTGYAAAQRSAYTSTPPSSTSSSIPYTEYSYPAPSVTAPPIATAPQRERYTYDPGQPESGRRLESETLEGAPLYPPSTSAPQASPLKAPGQ